MRQVDDVVEDSEPEREQRRRCDDEDGPDKGLSRFAYKSSLSSSHTPSVDPALSRSSHVVKKDPVDPQLARLSKCIGCGLQWTSRKTTKQKRTHIEQCAKKLALNKDTIKILIEKELAVLHPTQRPASSSYGPRENATATLMDSLVPTGPVKKPKRQQVVPTVRSLPETRESILDRVRDILGPTGVDQVDPQPTQHFAQSALAPRNPQQLKRPALLDVNKPMQGPPLTQPFGTSSLRGGITTPERSVGGCERPSLLPTQQFGPSMFAQDSVLSSGRRKRPASPPLVGSSSKAVRRRLLR